MNRYPEWYSYAYKEIEEREKREAQGYKIIDTLPKGIGVPLSNTETTPMTVVVEDADKTDAKPEETIYLGNNKILRVIGRWWDFIKNK